MKEIIKTETKSLPVEYLGFLSRYENYNTQKIVNHNVKNFVSFLSANGYDLKTIDQSIVNIYFNGLRKKGLANKTYNQNVSNVKQFLEYNGLNTFQYKTAKTEAYNNVKLVSETGFKNVIKYLEIEKDKATNKQIKYLRDYIIFNLLFLTGLRKNELISLKHSDIKPEGESYNYFARCKGGKEIKKEFPESLLSELAELKRLEKKSDKDYIFTSIYTKQDSKLSNRALNKILNTYYKKLNGEAESVTVHSIRNLSAFKLFNMTKDILKTKEHLNHSGLNTTNIYLSKLQNKKIDYYKELAGVLS